VKNNKVTVLGAGAWGTAIACLLSRNGNDVMLWSVEDSVAKEIESTRCNRKYLPDVEIHESVRTTSSLSVACEHSNVLVEVIPIAYLRSVLKSLSSFLAKDHSIVTTSKGIEAETLMLPLEIVESVCSAVAAKAVLGGPNFARDVALGGFSATMIASKDERFLLQLYDLFSSPVFKVVTSDDVIGVQVGGVLKNVVALAVGIAKGSGLSENSIAFVVTQGLLEMSRFAEKLGGKQETIFNLPGVGDLILASLGTQSRNMKAGIRLGQGATVETLSAEFNSMPEGINTMDSFREVVAKHGVSMSLCMAVDKIIRGKASACDLIMLATS